MRTQIIQERKIQNSCACEMHHVILLHQVGLRYLSPHQPVSGGPAALRKMGYPWGVSNRRGAAVHPGGESTRPPEDGHGRAHLLILRVKGLRGKDFQP